MHVINVEKGTDQRLDLYLSHYFAQHEIKISRTKVQALIAQENVKVNGMRADKKTLLNSGDRVELMFSLDEFSEAPKRVREIEAQEIFIEVLYEDEDIAVINKPKNMVVHLDETHREFTLVNALLHRFSSLSDLGGRERAGIVHRLDKETSGIMIVAKNNESHEKLKLQFQNREIFKSYLALVRGGFSVCEGVIDAPIGRSRSNRLLRAVDGEGAREARTRYRVVEECGGLSLVNCILETGRTHQIRVHMKHIKHPIYGDRLYGIKADRDHPNAQYLHSHTVGFTHFRTRRYMEFSCDLPAYFKETLKALHFQTIDF